MPRLCLARTTLTANMEIEGPTATKVSGQRNIPESQIKVQFITSLSDLKLPENTGPILVPTSKCLIVYIEENLTSDLRVIDLRRYGLSTLVNHLLGTESPTPFEFLISRSFLRTSLDDFLTAKGLSSENVLTVEYVRSLIPPLHVISYEHDDWVSSVDILSNESLAGKWADGAKVPKMGQERILSGSYDANIRVWNTSSEVLAMSPSAAEGGHSAGVKAAKFLSTSQLVSSSLDRTIRIWEYTESTENMSAHISPKLELYGHRASIDDISVHAPSHRILSASADHTVGVWSTKKSNAPAAQESLFSTVGQSSSKRRKLKIPHNTPKRGPIAELRSHSAPVSSVRFAENDSTVGYSASWDHTLRTWDLATAALVDTRTTSHALLSLEELPELHLIAAGTSARHITLIDPRVSAATTSTMTLRGHTNSVVSMARNPSNAYSLVSGSHDSTCRIWDVRSTKPGRAQENASLSEGAVSESIYTIQREAIRQKSKRMPGEEKVLDVAWDQHLGIVSAGEDKKLQINRGQSTGPAGGEE